MPESNSLTASLPARRWPKRLAIAGAVSLLLLVVLYFVATSAAFLKGVILPQVAKSMNARITLGDASISPFSQVVLRDLRVETTGPEPVVELRELRARYSLWSILGGTLQVDEVTIDSPTLRIVQQSDGSSNLDPLLQTGTEEPTPAPDPNAPPPRVALRNVTIKNGTVRLANSLPGGGTERTDLSGFQLSLDQVANGQPGKVLLSASLDHQSPTNGTLRATAAGDLGFSLDDALNPQTLKGAFKLDVASATGPLAQLAGAGAVLDCDLAPTELKQIALRFTKAGQALGELRLSGPLNLAKGEATLKLQAGPFDRQLLNLLAAGSGYDFGNTRFSASTDLTLARQWQQVTSQGRLAFEPLTLSQPGQSMPPLQLTLSWNLSADTSASTATLQAFDLTGNQGGKEILKGGLSQPMALAWGGASAQAGDARLQIQVNDLDFAAWRSMLGDAVSAGILQLQLALHSQQGGKQLNIEASGGIRGLTIPDSIPALDHGDLAWKFKSQVKDFQQVAVESLDIDLSRQRRSAFKLQGSARHDGVAFSSRKRVELNPFVLLGTGPATNLQFASELEGRYETNVLRFSRARLQLPATSLAPTNAVQITLLADLSRPDFTRTALDVASQALDLTPLYDAFAGAPSTNRPTETPPAPPAPAPGPQEEPAPMQLPLEVAFQAKVDRLFLREIAASNIVASAQLVSNRFTLDPFKLTLNGAPLSARADVNLGVRGYTYDTSFVADRIPLEPIANSFSPAYRGQFQGFIVANTGVKGAGVTGPSLQKHLSGQLGFALTNANLQIVGPKTRRLLVPIAALLRLEDLLQSPLNFITTQVDLGNGRANLTRFTVQSEAFEANSQGTIPLATNLNDSPLNLPVNFALRRSLAQKASLLPSNAPTNTPYVQLPDFVTLTGTVGQPDSDLKKTVITGLLVKSGAGIAEKLGVKVDDKTSGILQGVGDLLTGKPAANGATATNAPATNKPAAINPLDLLKRPKK